MEVYRTLRRRNGHLGWWPGRTRLEIIVGAILTQNTAWTNVEKAIRNLRAARLLSLQALRGVPEATLARAIRPSGYFRQKARKLKAFIAFLDEAYGGSLRRMARAQPERLRRELLGVWGIGRETADSILLYAFGHPVFVVDAYTRRILSRHGWIHPRADYEEIRRLFEERLPRDPELWNDYHAQLVWVGKFHCRAAARCQGCPLEGFLPRAGAPAAGLRRAKRA
jgi:endonuclease-3 related protein